MTIAIIGTGNVGSALARGWSRAGHRLVLGVRNPSEAKVAALAQQTKAEVKAPADAAAAAEVVVLALPWQAAESAVKTLGALQNKIVIDCMNPLTMRDERGVVNSPSAARHLPGLAVWFLHSCQPEEYPTHRGR